MSAEILAELKKINERFDASDARLAKVEASATEANVKAASVHAAVKGHADRIRAAADKMASDGFGMDEKRGHVKVLHHMADTMEADAHMGKLPHVYHTSDFMYAAAAPAVDEKAKEAMTALQAQVADLTAQLKAVQSQRFEASAQPERKTVSIHAATLLKRSGIDLGQSNKMDVHELDAALDKSGIDRASRLSLKAELSAAGAL